MSFYATIVFERYKRFGEILREVALARVHAEGYPISERDLARAHEEAFDYWRFLEARQWALDAEGHKAAAQVSRLVSFAYRTTACIERMMRDQHKGLAIGTYLMAFQSEFGRIKSNEFTQFEKKVRPGFLALVRPFPQSILPTKRETILVDFFDSMP